MPLLLATQNHGFASWHPVCGNIPCANASAPVIDVTFVDDGAFFIVARSPRVLMMHIEKTVDVVATVLSVFGFVVNFSKGKTELIVSLRGTHAKACKAKLAASAAAAPPEMKDEMHVPVSLSTGRSVRVCVVPSYKHLGSSVSGSGSLIAKAQNQAKSAMAAFAPLAKVIFGSQCVALLRKVNLAWSLVFSRLFFNVHTWSEFTCKPRSILEQVYMRVIRRIVGRPRFDAGAMPDNDVRMASGFPSIDCVVRARRLQYAARLVQADIGILLVASFRPWQDDAMVQPHCP